MLLLQPPSLVSDIDSRSRQYAGLAFVIIAYVGGIIGWSWATLTVESGPTDPDTTQTQVESPPSEAEPAESTEAEPAP